MILSEFYHGDKNDAVWMVIEPINRFGVVGRSTVGSRDDAATHGLDLEPLRGSSRKRNIHSNGTGH